MKFLCVPCDSPMKLQTVGPPEAGSLSVVYACPECGYEMAMLTNPFETQLVQSLGVRIGPAEQGGTSTTSGSRCPFPAMMPATEGNEAPAVHTGEPIPVRWTAAAEAGFRSAAVMRDHFGQIVGTTPLAYRRAFGRDRSAREERMWYG